MNPGPLAGEWIQYETESGQSLATVTLDKTNEIMLIRSMVTERIRPFSYFPGICQKPITLEVKPQGLVAIEKVIKHDDFSVIMLA